MKYGNTMEAMSSARHIPNPAARRTAAQKKVEQIPVYDFSRDDNTSIPFKLLRLEHKTGYDISEPHRHNYYEVFYFEEGSGQHMVDFEWLPIQPHSLHVVSPGQVHCVQRSADSSGYVVLFSRDFLLSNVANTEELIGIPLLMQPKACSAVLPEQQAIVVQMVLANMKQEWETGGRFSEDILRSYLHILLLKYASVAEQEGQQRDSVATQLVYRFKVAVERHFRRLHQVCDYAEQLAITPSHLNEATKKATGSNASDIIHERIVLEAKRLLLHSGLTTKEIASFLHFQDPSYFSRFFRKYTGHSPSEFKTSVVQHYGG